MSRSRVGLIIAGKSRTLRNDTVYNSNYKKLTVDPESAPSHFDLLNDFSGGTKWPITAGETREETLLQIRHNMPFVPMFYVYFLQSDTSRVPGGSIFAKQYTTNISYMLFNSVAYGEEFLYADADDTYFYIKHKFKSTVSSTTAYGSDFRFTIRYFIFNQPTFFMPGGQVEAL